MGKVVWGSLWGSRLPPSLLDSEDREHLWVPAGTWAVRLGAAGGRRDRQRGGRERGFVSILTLKSKKRGGGGGNSAMCCEFPGTLTLGDTGGGSPCISFCLVVLAGSFVYTAPVRPFKLLLMF